PAPLRRDAAVFLRGGAAAGFHRYLAHRLRRGAELAAPGPCRVPRTRIAGGACRSQQLNSPKLLTGLVIPISARNKKITKTPSLEPGGSELAPASDVETLRLRAPRGAREGGLQHVAIAVRRGRRIGRQLRARRDSAGIAGAGVPRGTRHVLRQ